jgi:hypothetical protein
LADGKVALEEMDERDGAVVPGRRERTGVIGAEGVGVAKCPCFSSWERIRIKFGKPAATLFRVDVPIRVVTDTYTTSKPLQPAPH